MWMLGSGPQRRKIGPRSKQIFLHVSEAGLTLSDASPFGSVICSYALPQVLSWTNSATSWSFHVAGQGANAQVGVTPNRVATHL